MKKEAMIVMASCKKTGKPFAIRTEKQGSEYVMNWAFQLKEGVAKREGFENNKVRGNIVVSPEYPGCPHCEAQTWFQCGQCGRFVCMEGEETVVKCPDCGNEAGLNYTDEFDLSGGGM